jgi:hypothetical protein
MTFGERIQNNRRLIKILREFEAHERARAKQYAMVAAETAWLIEKLEAQVEQEEREQVAGGVDQVKPFKQELFKQAKDEEQ